MQSGVGRARLGVEVAAGRAAERASAVSKPQIRAGLTAELGAGDTVETSLLEWFAGDEDDPTAGAVVAAGVVFLSIAVVASPGCYADAPEADAETED